MQLFGSAAAKAKPEGEESAFIKDGTLETFTRDVIQASMTVPVLVDFWAPWCGPCKQLTPVLEKIVKAAGGKVRLVKINVDENPELAAQFRVQSIPTVYAFLGGQPVTGFMGAQPESQIKALVEKLIGEPIGADLAADLEAARQAAERGDVKTAAAIYNAVLRADPENPEAIGGLARCLLAAGQRADAKRLLEKAPKTAANHPAIAGAKAAIQLAEEAGELGDPAALEARLAADPNDHDARYRLATLLFLRGQIEPAMEHLCTIVRKDRGWNDEAARKQLLKFFDALGPKHPATIKGRRMLSSVLFA
ncbi:MAG: thioredoxin [Geminicoccaceae bacterium]|nr:thioredoxin [Geminicoccaceae bacterium]MCX7630715.1 thioredoxin [Geminicoccaceae bacterium]MDW8123645.1 thioredoxin [Geminicoccaceae bacterium]